MKARPFYIICVLAVMLSGCTKLIKVKLFPRKYYSLPLLSERPVQDPNSTDPVIETPSEFYLYRKFLYISDKANCRVRQYNRNNELLLSITNKDQQDIDLAFIGSNRALLPFPLDQRLFHLNEPGKIWINENSIYVENLLGSGNEDHSENSYSFILKYDKTGRPVNVFGVRTGDNGIFPYINCEKFTLDENDD
ncbi:MAG: hypothetical protein PHF84_06815, partial [bacterium]|nr:hypothetical protein [bacterium]